MIGNRQTKDKPIRYYLYCTKSESFKKSERIYRYVKKTSHGIIYIRTYKPNYSELEDLILDHN